MGLIYHHRYRSINITTSINIGKSLFEFENGGDSYFNIDIQYDTLLNGIDTNAAMVTNYYWHVLKYDVSKGYYGLKEGYTLNTTELKQLKQFMEKHINFSINGY